MERAVSKAEHICRIEVVRSALELASRRFVKSDSERVIWLFSPESVEAHNVSTLGSDVLLLVSDMTLSNAATRVLAYFDVQYSSLIRVVSAINMW